MNSMLERLSKEFRVTDIIERHPGLTTLTVDKDVAETLLRELRDREGYTHLNFMTAIDYIEQGVFTLVYMLHNYVTKESLSVHVNIDRDNAEMTSIHTLWAQAWTYQRELRELWGIDFPGSPRIEEDFCLEGWDEIPPMRKEFDTVEYCERTFTSRDGRGTIDPREHMAEIIFPNRGGDK
jgi:NADH-quinone oxidoreductase subunit C